ncbi:MAG: LysM peptidoglycan-binding domain-containing protein [Firmicutes bacterium]|nr:LysM peptidoglycan-binding domain-containing protein [Bacillota bacterium]
MRPGDSGSDVRRLQAILKALGYDIELTGVFDEPTRRAVLDFQAQERLVKDGVIGPATRQRLEAAALWHTVARGETLWAVARTFGTTVELLMEVNDLSTSAIREGQRLLVPVGGFGNWAGDWRGYTVRPGDTLSAIATRFHVSPSELARLNALRDPDSLRVGQRLKLPADLSERTGSPTGSGARQPVSVFPLSWPLPEKGRISSGFGWRNNPFGGGGREFHGGIDVAVRLGTPVRAAAAGVVVEAGWMGAYGYGVVIDHGRGVQTLYGHNARVLVQPGQRVERAQHGAAPGLPGPHQRPPRQPPGIRAAAVETAERRGRNGFRRRRG